MTTQQLRPMRATASTPEPYFSTPEDVAARFGLKVTTVRRLAKQHGLYTPLERRRMAFSPDDEKALRKKIAHPERPVTNEDGHFDPFIPTPRS